MKQGRCKGCGKAVWWIKTPAGKSMPVDKKPVEFWARDRAPGKVVTQTGHVVCCDFDGKAGSATGRGYIPHFATCPKAKRFKKSKESLPDKQLSLLD